MKQTFTLFLLVFVCAGLAPGQQKPDRFAGLNGKIDALLSPRLKPEPLPAKPANPFLFSAPGSELLTPTPTRPLPTNNAPTDDNQILAFCLSKLRISGTFQQGGVTHLLINSATYRESDLVPVRATGDTVYYVRIANIGASEVTFGYNEASVKLRLP